MVLLNGVLHFQAVSPVDQDHLNINLLYQILCNPFQVNVVCKF